MTDVFVVMGDGGTRKSSTIRALTGAFQRGVYRVAISARHEVNIYVQISALQESQISPRRFIRRVNRARPRVDCVLVSLWINSVRNRPDGFTYINHFIRARWNIKGIVVLGQNSLLHNLPHNTPRPRFIQNSRRMATNRIASKIRSWWGWL